MKNRFMLAPLTNTQSHEDGRLSDDELHWLTLRAKGQFGLVMTCASYVQANGKGFSGQLGIHADAVIPSHQRLTQAIRGQGALSVIQLYHGGMRASAELTGEQPICPSANEKHGARAMTLEEVHQTRDAFIAAAVRAKTCGYDGVELHGAHGYLLCQFLSTKLNQRTDAYGGNLTNRARLLFEIVEGVRKACGPQFLLGVRLSPERFGMELTEIKELCLRFAADQLVDFLDISLWDVRKAPEDSQYGTESILSHFTQLDLQGVRLTAAGKVRSAQDVVHAMDQGIDFVTIGRSGILHHDFPIQVMNNPDFTPVPLPVTADYLRSEGVGTNFINYLGNWPKFVE